MRQLTVRKKPEAGLTLNDIYGRLDRGEIDVNEAQNAVQAYDRRHVTRLDRLLELLSR